MADAILWMIRHQGAAQKAADEAMRDYYRRLSNRNLKALAEQLESADRNDYDDDGSEGAGGFRPHLEAVRSILRERKAS